MTLVECDKMKNSTIRGRKPKWKIGKKMDSPLSKIS
jgi:hypothetical protein